MILKIMYLIKIVMEGYMKKSIIMKCLIMTLAMGLFLLPMGMNAQVKKPIKPVKPILLKLPDLLVSAKCPSQAHPGEELGDRIKVIVKNKGPVPARDFSVDLVLSSDVYIPKTFAKYSPNYHEDVLLKGGREYVKLIAGGGKLILPLHGSNKIPDDTPPGTYYLAVVVDPGKKVKEINEKNNTALCRMEIVSPLSDLIVSGFAHTGAPAGQPPECRLIVEIRNIGLGPVPTGRGRLDVYVNDVLVDSIDLDSDKVEKTAWHDFHQPYDPGNPGRSRSMVGTDYIFPSSTTFVSYNCRAVIDPLNEIEEYNEGNNTFERVEQIPAH